jgi:hypothetical protein
MSQGFVKNNPPFFMAWKFSSNVSMYIPSIILDYVHAHLDGRGWYMDLLKRDIPHSKLELDRSCQAFALQLPSSTLDLPMPSFAILNK